MRNDRKMIVGAAGKADKAVSHILGENVEGRWSLSAAKWRTQKMEEFMWKTGNMLPEMRLVIEGAIQLFDESQERDTLETALYHLKDRISELQEAYWQASVKEKLI